MTNHHMHQAVVFLEKQGHWLRQLIEEIVTPQSVPTLMPDVLSGNHLKFIIDFSQKKPAENLTGLADHSSKKPADHFYPEGLCGEIIKTVKPLPEALHAAARTKIDNKTKPLGALGRLESLAVQMSRIQNSLTPSINNKQLFVFAADHGITEEGVSAYPTEVTAQMVTNFLNGGAAINVLCRHHGIALKIIDMGVKHTFAPHPDLLIKKVARGTRNFAIENAMSREQMIAALENGIKVFLEADAVDKIDIVGLGEMGIGNTTSATAIIASITGINPGDAAGRGTGIDDHGLKHKIEVLKRVLDFHHIDSTDGFSILQKIGGFEIAGIVGAVLAAASRQCAIVLDGVISTAAGLVAYLIKPEIGGYLVAGHKSVEKAQAAALAHMGLAPLIDLDLRLGEGTGAALAIDMAEAACRIMCEMASFDEAKVARSRMPKEK